jgi:hypothetical protein
LQASLQNHCDYIFSRCESLQERWELIFRNLAFKEPNTGTYTRQRMNVAALQAQYVAKETLQDVLAPWMNPHGYIIWDSSNQTIKVAHETLIRRWERLRRWIDEEDHQFQVYLRLLEDCSGWESSGRWDSALSSSEAIRRFEEAGLPAALQAPQKVERFAQLLALDREGERLATHAQSAGQFLLRSIGYRQAIAAEQLALEERHKQEQEKLAEARRQADVQAARAAVAESELTAQEARAKAAESELKAHAARAQAAEYESRAQKAASDLRASRERVQRYVWIGAALLLLTTAGISVCFNMTVKKENALETAYVLAAETQLGFDPVYTGFDELELPLRNVIEASHEFENGRHLRNGVAAIPGLGHVLQHDSATLDLVERLSARRNRESLERIVQNMVWKIRQSEGGASAKRAQGCNVPTEPNQDVSSASKGPNAQFFGDPASGGQTGLIMLAQDAGASFEGTVIFAGTLDATRSVCVPKKYLYSTPQGEQVNVGVAEDLTYVVFEFAQNWQFYAIQWDDSKGAGLEQTQLIPHGDVLKGKNERTRQFPAKAVFLPSTHSSYATDLQLPNIAVRLFDLQPTNVSPEEVKQATALSEGDKCNQFATPSSADNSKSKPHIFEVSATRPGEPSYCVFLEKRPAVRGEPQSFVRLYEFTNGISVGSALPLPALDGQPVGSLPVSDFHVNSQTGWLIYKTGEHWKGLPWSLDAWRRLADGVFAPGVADNLHDAGSKQMRRVYDLLLSKKHDKPNDRKLKEEIHRLVPATEAASGSAH